MIGKKLALALASLVALTSLSGPATAQARPQNGSLYVLGDSNSDIGSLFVATGGRYPVHPTYFWGRASNGPAWNERLGYSMGYSPNLSYVEAPWGGFQGNSRGISLAHYGATVVRRTGLMTGQSLTNQVDYLTFLYRSGQIRRTNLRTSDVVIWAGTNDYLAYGERTPARVVNGLVTAATSLSRTGFRNILLVDQPRWGSTPFGVRSNWTASLNALMDQHNSQLTSRVRNSTTLAGARVGVAAVSGLIRDIQARPAAYGYTNVATGARTTGTCLGDGYVGDACPRGYLWYDNVHFTAQGHQTLSQFLAASWRGLYAWDAYSGAAAASSNRMMSAVAIARGIPDAGEAANARVGFGLSDASVQSTDGRTRVFALSQAGDEPSAQGLTSSDSQLDLIGMETEVSGGVTLGFARVDGSVDPQGFRGRTREQAMALFSSVDLGALAVKAQWLTSEQTLRGTRATGFDVSPVARTLQHSHTEIGSLEAATQWDVGGWAVRPSLKVVHQTMTADPVVETEVVSFLAQSLPERRGSGVAAKVALAVNRSLDLGALGDVAIGVDVGFAGTRDPDADLGVFARDLEQARLLAGLSMGEESASARFAGLSVAGGAQDGLRWAIGVDHADVVGVADTRALLTLSHAW